MVVTIYMTVMVYTHLYSRVFLKYNIGQGHHKHENHCLSHNIEPEALETSGD